MRQHEEAFSGSISGSCCALNGGNACAVPRVGVRCRDALDDRRGSGCVCFGVLLRRGSLHDAAVVIDKVLRAFSLGGLQERVRRHMRP